MRIIEVSIMSNMSFPFSGTTSGSHDVVSIERIGAKVQYQLNVLMEKLARKTDALTDTMDSAKEN